MVTIWSGLLDNSLVNDCGVTMLGPLSSTVAQVDGIPVFVPLRCLLLGQGMTQFYARIFFSSVCTESHVLRPLCGQGSLFQGSVGLQFRHTVRYDHSPVSILRVFIYRRYGFNSRARVLLERNPNLPPSVSFAGVAAFRVVAMASVDSFRVVLFLFCFPVMSLGLVYGLWSFVT